MTPLVAIHPYTLHRENRACAKARRVENTTNQHDFYGEQNLHAGFTRQGSMLRAQAPSSRNETEQTVSIWDCVHPDAAFAAQVIAQALPARRLAVAKSAYGPAQSASAKLLDRLV